MPCAQAEVKTSSTPAADLTVRGIRPGCRGVLVDEMPEKGCNSTDEWKCGLLSIRKCWLSVFVPPVEGDPRCDLFSFRSVVCSCRSRRRARTSRADPDPRAAATPASDRRAAPEVALDPVQEGRLGRG